MRAHLSCAARGLHRSPCAWAEWDCPAVPATHTIKTPVPPPFRDAPQVAEAYEVLSDEEKKKEYPPNPYLHAARHLQLPHPQTLPTMYCYPMFCSGGVVFLGLKVICPAQLRSPVPETPPPPTQVRRRNL